MFFLHSPYPGLFISFLVSSPSCTDHSFLTRVFFLASPVLNFLFLFIPKQILKGPRSLLHPSDLWVVRVHPSARKPVAQRRADVCMVFSCTTTLVSRMCFLITAWTHSPGRSHRAGQRAGSEDGRSQGWKCRRKTMLWGTPLSETVTDPG